jgi:hypothetical protein
MIAKNGKIKVIKRGEVIAPAPKQKAAKVEKRHAAREIVSTVSNWVTDFQTRKREETKAAIETFFVSKPRVSEM